MVIRGKTFAVARLYTYITNWHDHRLIRGKVNNHECFPPQKFAYLNSH